MDSKSAPATDPLGLAQLMAKELRGRLGSPVVACVVRRYVDTIDALKEEGYTAERIFAHVLSLTRETAPEVTLSALRRALARARKTRVPVADRPAGMARPSARAGADPVTQAEPAAAPQDRRHQEALARIKTRASRFGPPGSR